MLRVKGTDSVVIKASPAKAWDFIIEPDNWAYLPFLKHAKVTSPSGKIKAGRDVYLHLVTVGVNHNVRIKFSEFKRPVSMAWKGEVRYSTVSPLWPSMLLDGRMDFEKVKEGVRVTIDMSMYPDRKLLDEAAFYLMTRVLNFGQVFNDTICFILTSFRSRLED